MANTSRKFVFEGMEELRAMLRKLPPDCVAEARNEVESAANGAASTIQAFYGQHRVTGQLRDSVRVSHIQNAPLTAQSVVRINSPLAWIFDHGTQARHYYTHNGKKHLTGRMPPTHIAGRTASKARNRMNQRLKAMLVRKGLIVTGEAA